MRNVSLYFDDTKIMLDFWKFFYHFLRIRIKKVKSFVSNLFILNKRNNKLSAHKVMKMNSGTQETICVTILQKSSHQSYVLVRIKLMLVKWTFAMKIPTNIIA